MTNAMKKQRLWPEVRTTFQVTMAEKKPFLQKRLQVKFKDDCENLGQEIYRRVGLTVL